MAPFRADGDGFEWLINAESLEKIEVDRWAIRTVMCYLMDLLKEESMLLLERDDCVFLDLKREISDSALNDLNQIALVSNFSIYKENSCLNIEVM